jgi:hypothetical protein
MHLSICHSHVDELSLLGSIHAKQLLAMPEFPLVHAFDTKYIFSVIIHNYISIKILYVSLNPEVDYYG